jgi:nudix-type nucleoside diphosphatase (YffH/AdpP family)
VADPKLERAQAGGRSDVIAGIDRLGCPCSGAAWPTNVTIRNSMTISDRVRVKDVRVLSDSHYVLKEVTFDYRRGDGQWQTQKREVFDRGHAATLLPYNLASRTVVLVRQFRLPAFLAGHDDLLIEAAAGMLDDETPEKRIRAEAEEEIGFRLGAVSKVFEAFMSPGAVTEKLHFFVAEYEAAMRVGSGGGLASEGEDIEVLELPIDEALAMIADGRIADAKTIMLLQYAALHIFK